MSLPRGAFQPREKNCFWFAEIATWKPPAHAKCHESPKQKVHLIDCITQQGASCKLTLWWLEALFGREQQFHLKTFVRFTTHDSCYEVISSHFNCIFAKRVFLKNIYIIIIVFLFNCGNYLMSADVLVRSQRIFQKEVMLFVVLTLLSNVALKKNMCQYTWSIL